jgi:hypothetical protein
MKWIKIEDEFPHTNGLERFLFIDDGVVCCGYADECVENGNKTIVFYEFYDGVHYKNVKYWMPLPKPPQ